MAPKIKKPRISILMATYNRAGLISRAIKSALAQSYTDWELIIADGGSTDETAALVKEWQEQDRRVHYIPLGHIGRIATVSNGGLAKALGEFIAVLDDDDYWADPEKLKKQVGFLDRNPDYVGCGGGMIIVNENGKETGRVLKPEHNEDITRKALLANTMANSTTLFRFNIAKKIGLYDETLQQFADWDFWLRMGLSGKLYNFQEYFTNYAMWSGGSSFRRQKECARAALIILWKYHSKYPNFIPALFVACVYFLYVHLPEFIKRFTNPVLSRLKKNIFSR